MISTLWQLGVLSATIIFGLKIGLASGLANLSKKYALAISVSYGLGVLVCAKIASFYTSQLTQAIYSYNTWFFVAMAVVMISAGVLTIREYKVHEKNTTTATCLAVIAPCPCCFGSIVVSVLLVAPTIGMGVFTLSEYVALALFAVIIATYFASHYIVKIIKKPYPVILGNFMFFLGLYFLLSAIVIPNIAAVMGKSVGGGITLMSTNSLVLILVTLIALVIVGVIYGRKTSFLE